MDFGTDRTTYIPFGKGSLEPNEFFGRDKYPTTGDPYYESVVEGSVRVRRQNGDFHYKAHGFFLQARSESGLSYGGGSTGSVDWKAHN